VGNCGTCKHWENDKPEITRRACNNIKTFDQAFEAKTLANELVIAFGEHGAHIQTRADFGCVMWALPAGDLPSGVGIKAERDAAFGQVMDALRLFVEVLEGVELSPFDNSRDLNIAKLGIAATEKLRSLI